MSRFSIRLRSVLAGVAILTAASFAQPVNITTPTTIGPLATTINGVPLGSAQITVGATTLTINGRHTIGSLSLGANATLTHDPAFSYEYAPGDVVNGMDLHVNAGVNMAANSAINVTGKGFLATMGPGAGGTTAQTGAGHGGNGGPFNTGGAAYDIFDAPGEFGSGGWGPINLSAACIASTGTIGRGGGCVSLVIGGTLQQNGNILANGGAGGVCGSNTVGGGAGGSIYIYTFAHNGGAGTVIAANGGEYPSAGGCISLDVETIASYTGTVTAYGGSTTGTTTVAGVGTIMRHAGGLAPYQVLIRGDASHQSDSDTPLRDFNTEELQIFNATLALAGINSTTNGEIQAGGTLSPVVGEVLQMIVSDTLYIRSGGKVSATGRGFGATGSPSTGPSTGSGAFDGSPPRGGGGGGNFVNGGAAASGSAGGVGIPGDAYKPARAGSAGGAAGDGAFALTFGGAGGGVIDLEVGNTLSMEGDIVADGAPGRIVTLGSGTCTSCAASTLGSGGGAGGSILLNVGNSITNTSITSRIHAWGGTSDDSSCAAATRAGSGCGGGGAGGAVAVYCCSVSLLPTSSISATGGGAKAVAGAGQTGTVIQGSGEITISSQPHNAGAITGMDTSFSVAATTTRVPATLTYRWRHDGALLSNGGRISGATTAHLVISGVQCSDFGNYDVIVSDSCGPFPSDSAALSVTSVADFNQDGGVDGQDVEAFYLAWEVSDASADTNQDGGVDGQDVETFFRAWETGGC